MMTRPVSLDLDEITALKTPCLLHWNFNHFVVLVSVKRHHYVLHDPARGRRTEGRAEMSRYFTGVALEAWPGSDFTAETDKNTFRISSLINSVHHIKGTLSKIFALSLVIETIGLVMPIGTQLVMDYAIPAGDKGLLTLICLGLMFFICDKHGACLVVTGHGDINTTCNGRRGYSTTFYACLWRISNDVVWGISNHVLVHSIHYAIPLPAVWWVLSWTVSWLWAFSSCWYCTAVDWFGWS